MEFSSIQELMTAEERMDELDSNPRQSRSKSAEYRKLHAAATRYVAAHPELWHRKWRNGGAVVDIIEAARERRLQEMETDCGSCAFLRARSH